ncbi:helix-turn-helix domain-containing protein [Caulobacter sp. 17J80-11]|uniref:winged helix-turn-helix transcriptional regulator n=1 Tax=Caulobacter sp. 17J80-11 TaxID=2763502 RepID=UPI001653E564|nr:helix-turn-helix domain-containing protein [Caulobacter sp. 17J80-11]MBC6980377.1 helix-turn-helix transcriptional regulator [Caulobacter sp. 17J80-11]
MEKKVTKRAPTLCPVARAEDLVGDRWTVLVLRELFGGARRFDEIQAGTEATPQMAAARLKQMEADGLIERRPYSQRPLRHEYHLTEKGRAFFPVLLALRAWGETWCKAPGEARAVEFTHDACGGPAGLGPLCETCGRSLSHDDLTAERTPAYAREREQRLRRFKGLS